MWKADFILAQISPPEAAMAHAGRSAGDIFAKMKPQREREMP
jgi:hypothetical protein